MAKQLCEVSISSNVPALQEASQEAIIKALETCGLIAEGYAKLLCPVDTGNLRNSITHQVDVDEGAVYIGTNVEYAAYVELGTGIENVEGGTLKKSWVYMGEDGEWYIGKPQKPRPFLKPAVADHLNEWQGILKEELKNG